MTLPVRTAPQADLHILEIDLWWRQNRDWAPDLFEQELSMACKMIGASPYIGRRFPHPEISGVRRLLMRATRNHIYYVVLTDHVLVLAVWGGVKGSGPDLTKV
jgi:plasmid stabilization system protein ParE